MCTPSVIGHRCYSATTPTYIERMKPPTTPIQFAQHVEILASLATLAQCVSMWVIFALDLILFYFLFFCNSYSKIIKHYEKFVYVVTKKCLIKLDTTKKCPIKLDYN